MSILFDIKRIHLSEYLYKMSYPPEFPENQLNPTPYTQSVGPEPGTHATPILTHVENYNNLSYEEQIESVIETAFEIGNLGKMKIAGKALENSLTLEESFVQN